MGRLRQKAPKDQWTYCETLGKRNARSDSSSTGTWVTESTISDLADAGITHVRIPIGQLDHV